MIFPDELLKGNVSDEIHKNLTRFGKGIFENRALMKITIAKQKLNVTASYDLVKDITIAVAKNFTKIKASGKLIHGKKKEDIDHEVSGEDLLNMCKEYDYLLLNLSFDEYSVKVGKSLPKPGSDLKNNFCKCILPLSILDELTEKRNFKKLQVYYTIKIENIIIPDEYKNNFEEARKHSLRGGKIIRNLTVDGNTETKEAEFKA